MSARTAVRKARPRVRVVFDVCATGCDELAVEGDVLCAACAWSRDCDVAPPPWSGWLPEESLSPVGDGNGGE